MLRKVKPYVPQATLQMMYKSFVLPYFNYCSTIWYDGNKMHAEKMLKLQKRAARVITSSGLEERSSEIFQHRCFMSPLTKPTNYEIIIKSFTYQNLSKFFKKKLLL